MATEVRLPDLGEGIDDAIVSRWMIQEGDSVKEGDPLVEIATDKVDTEMPSPASGVLLKTLVGEGELVPAGSLLGYVGEAGEAVPADSGSEGAKTSEAPPESEEELADRYMEKLDKGAVYDFCIIPLLLAKATLEAIANGQEKLSRGEVKALMASLSSP